jgi:hypothetical protein
MRKHGNPQEQSMSFSQTKFAGIPKSSEKCNLGLRQCIKAPLFLAIDFSLLWRQTPKQTDNLFLKVIFALTARKSPCFISFFWLFVLGANLIGWFLCCIVSNMGISATSVANMTYKKQGISAFGEDDINKPRVNHVIILSVKMIYASNKQALS